MALKKRSRDFLKRLSKKLGKDSHLSESQTPTLIKNIVDILDTVPIILLDDPSTPNLDAGELRGYCEVISSRKKVQNCFKGLSNKLGNDSHFFE